MKKYIIAACALIPALGASADYGYSSHGSGMSGFILFVMIAYIVLSIVVLVRWWKMTADVERIRQQVTHANPRITYLVLTGDKEAAQKAAVTTLVELLCPIYEDGYNYIKAEAMNKIINERLPKFAKLGLSVPDYLTSGEKFIDHVNALTGNNVAYKEAMPQ